MIITDLKSWILEFVDNPINCLIVVTMSAACFVCLSVMGIFISALFLEQFQEVCWVFAGVMVFNVFVWFALLIRVIFRKVQT